MGLTSILLDIHIQILKAMGKLSKVLVCGQVACGKTALLEQLIYGNHVVGAVSRKSTQFHIVVVFEDRSYLATDGPRWRFT